MLEVHGLQMLRRGARA